MTLSQLRRRHPRLIYRDFEAKPDGKNLLISFNFLLEPDIRFRPEISIPAPPSLRGRLRRPWQSLVFHLGMIEALSYWKAACPQELVVKAGYLSEEQISWWKHLFIHGLGEFFYRNRIDFTKSDFLTITSQPSLRASPSDGRSVAISSGLPRRYAPRNDGNGDLILVGGGKDSIVTMETLKNDPNRKNALMLNPGPNSLAAAGLAGYKNPLIISRKIDPKLFQLNKPGYLNGHTPFSAYIAFTGVLVAYLHGFKHVISSNELSAGEASLTYKSMEINHQYSKSFAFEENFRNYCRKYLFTKQSPHYFSFLRPLYELQIAKLFSQLDKYDSVFASCNVGRGNFWCGRCPKCAFSYLSLFPFMDAGRLKRIFGRDLFEAPEIQNHILDLVGLGQYKPLDCVGTKNESILAMSLAIKKINRRQATGDRRQDFLLQLQQELHLDDQESVKKLEKRIMGNWSHQNFLPPEYSKLLSRHLERPRRYVGGVERSSSSDLDRPPQAA